MTVVVECGRPLCSERGARKTVEVPEERGVILMPTFICRACLSTMAVVRKVGD